jgi:NADH-quinone oxidoreductase subunit L
MRVMGGLRARMPVTFAVYVVGALALAGIPPLAGFFSKDEILAEAMAHNSAVYILLTLAAFCTAFYMGRQIWLVFFGTPRSAGAEQAHESRPVMTIPLVVLAALAALGGLLNLPGVHSLGHWLEHTLGHGEAAEFNPIVALTSTVLALAAPGLAYFIYNRPLVPGFEDPLALRLGPLFTAFNRQWVVDAGYERFIVRPYCRLGIWAATADDLVFVWLERQMARVLQLGSAVLRKSQSGHLSWNVAGIVGGLIVVLLLLLIGG